jgi:hypothetical protein
MSVTQFVSCKLFSWIQWSRVKVAELRAKGLGFDTSRIQFGHFPCLLTTKKYREINFDQTMLIFILKKSMQ